MPPYDPNREMNGMPAGEPAPEPPPEAGGMETPGDPLGPMAAGLKQASPEEQEEADRFVARAWQVIYDDNTFPTIVEMLRGGAGPATPPEAGAEAGAVQPLPGIPPEGPPGSPAPATGAPPEGVPPEGAPPEGAPPPEAPAEGEGDPVKGLAQATDLIVSLVGQMAEDSGHELQTDAVFHAAGDIFEELAEISRRAKIKDYSKDRDAMETAWFQALDLYRERLQSAGVIDQEAAQADLNRLIAADKDGSYERIMRDLAASDESGPAGGPEPPPQKEKKPRGFNAAMGV